MVPLVPSEAAMWQESLDSVVPAIVVIRVCSVRAFDGENAGYGKATGFVVDKARGIILTNRHVITPGPTMADAVFMNKEEVDLVPIYYDPFHDFGFYRFDPKAVRFMEVAEVELNPDGAKVGVEIRVVGNDSGEKLSILPGILARLDRAAPDYDSGSYRDFNTFYLAAASSTSGGSSGSPVLSVDGKAVALNCGARVETAAAFYLPLPKIVRALKLIKRGEKVTRGTLQTVLKHTAFDESRRLGLSPDAEALLRKEFPKETGVLVVEEVIPGGPADGALEPGDVVVRMNGDMITTFLPWEAFLDDGIGEEVEVQVQRGGREVTVRLRVGDLQAITPSEYLDASSSVLQPLSYQQARNYNLPVKGVYVAKVGYMLERAWIASQSLIMSIGSDPTPDLDACEAALCKHADGARVSVRYKALGDRHRTKTAVITIDRKWFTMQRVRRNDEDGLWYGTPSPLPPSAPPPCVPRLPDSKDMFVAQTKVEGSTSCGIFPSLVKVVFDIPHLVDGVSGRYCVGVGVVVDRELGLVVVDKTTVQVALGDVMLTFNGSEEVAARPIFSHPTQNFSVVQFDPSLVRGSFTAAVLSSRETEHEEDEFGNTGDIRGGFENGNGDINGDRSSNSSSGISSNNGGSGGSGSSNADRSGSVKGSNDGGAVRNNSSSATSTISILTTATATDTDTTIVGSSGKGRRRKEREEEGEERAPPADALIPSSPLTQSPKLPQLANWDSCHQDDSPTSTTPLAAGDKKNLRMDAGGRESDADCDSPPPLRPGDTAEFYGLTTANAPVRQRAAVVKLERISLATSAHPQFTAHSVEVLQFDQITSCLGGLFVAVPRLSTASLSPSLSPSPAPAPSSSTLPPLREGNARIQAPGASSTPVVSAFLQGFAFTTSDGRKQTMRGLPAPVVRRAMERIRRDLLKSKGKERNEEQQQQQLQQQQQQQQQQPQQKRHQQQQPQQERQLEPQQERQLEPQQQDEERQQQGERRQESRGAIGNPLTVAKENDSSGVADARRNNAPGEVAAAAAATVEQAPVGVETNHSATMVGGEGEGVAEAVQAAAAAAAVGGRRGQRDDDALPVAAATAAPTAPAAAEAATAAATAAAQEVSTEDKQQPSVSSAEKREEGNFLGAAPCLPLSLVAVELSKARAGLGLSDEWSSRIERKCGERRQKQVLEVRRCMAGTPAFSVVETGDIILAANGKTVTSFRGVEVAVEEGEGEPVRLDILRQLVETQITVEPSYLPTRETDRLFVWAGQMIQAPHLAVLQLGFLPIEGGGVYSSRWCYGSPAHKYSLWCTNWIVEVNGVPTPTLDAFLDAVKRIGDKSPARVKTVGLDSKVEVTTLRTDNHYWPTLELRRSGDRWTRTVHKGAPGTTTSTSPDASRRLDTSPDASAPTSTAFSSKLLSGSGAKSSARSGGTVNAVTPSASGKPATEDEGTFPQLTPQSSPLMTEQASPAAMEEEGSGDSGVLEVVG